MTDPAVDEMVALLLRAGADPESPAEWADSHPSGSAPPTALVTLVTLAQRTYPGQVWEGERLRLMEAQRRALDRLIAAGASLGATDAHGRPLAVLAVTGRYDPRGGMRPRQELAAGWLTRLAAAGMDVNATWLGSTALDWLDRMEMADTPTARELAALGGRRLSPAPPRDGSRF
jgi:hypothetical protein